MGDVAWDRVKNFGSSIYNGIGGWANRAGLNGITPEDKAKQDRLNNVGNAAFANYGSLSGRLDGALNDLQATAHGQNSVSAEQLRQGQMANVAQQQSLAAGASPQNSAMAARTAANNTARLGYGLSSQQALAGLQERQQAQQQYASLLGASRGQDLTGALGGYGGGLNGMQDPNKASGWGAMLQGVASIL